MRAVIPLAQNGVEDHFARIVSSRFIVPDSMRMVSSFTSWCCSERRCPARITGSYRRTYRSSAQISSWPQVSRRDGSWRFRDHQVAGAEGSSEVSSGLRCRIFARVAAHLDPVPVFCLESAQRLGTPSSFVPSVSPPARQHRRHCRSWQSGLTSRTWGAGLASAGSGGGAAQAQGRAQWWFRRGSQPPQARVRRQYHLLRASRGTPAGRRSLCGLHLSEQGLEGILSLRVGQQGLRGGSARCVDLAASDLDADKKREQGDGERGGTEGREVTSGDPDFSRCSASA